jgi:hypothetical protein
MKPGAPPAAGTGPEAVPTEAKSYAEISAENARRELAEASLGRWSAEAKPPLPPGEVPRLIGGPWAQPDGFGVDAAVDINGSDPSGTLKNRGID